MLVQRAGEAGRRRQRRASASLALFIQPAVHNAASLDSTSELSRGSFCGRPESTSPYQAQRRAGSKDIRNVNVDETVGAYVPAAAATHRGGGLQRPCRRRRQGRVV